MLVNQAGFDYHLVNPADVNTLQNILAVREADPAAAVRH